MIITLQKLFTCSKIYLFPVLLVSALFTSCSNDAVNITPPKPEFILNTDDLKDFKSWPLKASFLSVKNNQWRKIYLKLPEGGTVVDGVYPQGTVIVKEIHSGVNITDTILRYQVMSKRGGEANPKSDGWEWILTKNDITKVVSRGGNQTMVNGKTCVSCHLGKKDWVISTLQ